MNDDGSFKDTLRMSSDFYVLRQDRNATNIFAPKGSDLNIVYNAKKKDSTLQLSGSENSTNKYILDKEKVTKTIRGDEKELYLKNEADFKTHLLKIKTAQEDLLSKAKGVSNEYRSSEIKNINYEFLSTLSNYQTYHGYYIKDRSFKVSDNFLAELNYC